MRRLWPLMLLLLGCDAITDIFPPDVRIVKKGQEVTREGKVKVWLVVDVSDNKVVDRVELYVDGNLVETRDIGRKEARVDFEVEGRYTSHSLKVRAYDRVGNWGEVKYSSPYPRSPYPLPVLVFVPGGEFQMGDLWGDGDSDERPVHTVRVDDFYMSKYEITNAQYVQFLNAIGRHWMGGKPLIETKSMDSHSHILLKGGRYVVESGYEDHPMIEVSWYGAVAFCNWLSRQAGLEEVYDEGTWEADFSKVGYRLPTEAEWEYAARAGGKEIKYPNGNTLTHDDANYRGIGGRDKWERTSSVGSFPPNELGLYDMAGNVWEWCNDWYDSGYYSVSPVDNPRGPLSGEEKVLRGGSWYNDPWFCRTANRNVNNPGNMWNNLGFRVVLPVR